ncbi:polymeric immunoglobulin receptor isoform X2 [Cololabis saira]|uniref:polymeric immunoglobulin receptor isoform X2 n=1 Tax=Cololabis saira TaxID=129043 RepID=UPI002AD5AC7D|nr:polymeric immunoglobulin receptor isoform X2 [Cololabis saira]
MTQLFILALSWWIPAFLCGVTTEKEFAVLEGRSLTIPCHYEPQYATYVKYWCQGRTREFCSSLARTDDPRVVNPAQDKVSIFDDPVQLVFTVTMNNLKEGDSGWYMCGVEIGGLWSADVSTFTNIKVIHGMSVVNSRIYEDEGSTATVECHYSERYRESEKKWCRSGDWRSCLSTGPDGSYEDSSVAITDDRTRAFTVTLKKLEMRDTGWYWCSAGQQKITVHVVVAPKPTTTVSVTSPLMSRSPAYLPPPKPITKDSWKGHSHMMASVAVLSSVVVLVGAIVLVTRLWRLHRKDPLREVDDRNSKFTRISGDAGDFQSAAVIFLNKDSQEVHMY